MKNILVLGNTLASAKFVELMRNKNKDVAITLVSPDGFFPYSRQSLLDFLGKTIKEKQIYFKPENFYKEEKIQVITGQPVVRINFKRNHVVLENKTQLPYDVLILEDIAAPRLPEIKGVLKNGVFHTARLSNVRAIIDQLPFAQTVVLQLSHLSGFLNVCTFTNYAKEIVVACGQETLLGGMLDAESSSILKQLLEVKGVRLMMGNPIEEILGDGDLKAVRLKSGKVLSTEMVVVDDLRCDTRIFKDTGFENVSESFNGSSLAAHYPNVFMLDAVYNAFVKSHGNQYELLDQMLLYQGQRLAEEIVKEERIVEKQKFVLKFGFKDLSGCWFGQTNSTADIQSYCRFVPQENVYRKLFVRQGQLTGGFIIDQPMQIDKILSMYADQVLIQDVEHELMGDLIGEPSLVGVQQQG